MSVKVYHASSFFKRENIAGQESPRREDADALLYVLYSKQLEYLQSTGRKVQYSFYTGIAMLLFTLVFLFISAEVSVVLLIVSGATWAYYFYMKSRKPTIELLTLSKVYWPFSVVQKKDGRQVIQDSLGLFPKVEFNQYGFANRDWKRLSEKIIGTDLSHVETNDKPLLNLALNMDGLLVALLYRRRAEIKGCFLESQSQITQKLFLDENSYLAVCSRTEMPKHVLDTNLEETLSQHVKLSNYLYRADSYTKETMDELLQYRKEIGLKISDLKTYSHQQIKRIAQKVRSQQERIEEEIIQLRQAFSPTCVLMKGMYEPFKAVLDTLSSLGTAQIEISNFLHMEQLRLGKEKERLKILEQEQKSSQQMKSEIDDINAMISMKRNRAKRIIDDIATTRQTINETMEYIREREQTLRRVNKYQYPDSYNAIVGDINEAITRLDQQRSHLNDLLREKEKIQNEIQTLSSRKKKTVELAKKRRAEARNLRRQQALAEKNHSSTITSKVGQVDQLLKQKTHQELELLRKLLARAELSMEEIDDGMESIRDDGMKEEYLRQAEHSVISYGYLFLTHSILQNFFNYHLKHLVKDKEERTKYYMPKIVSSTVEEEVPKNFMVLIPFWITKTRDLRTGTVKTEVIRPQKITWEKMAKDYTNDFTIEYFPLTQVPPDLGKLLDQMIHDKEGSKKDQILNVVSEANILKDRIRLELLEETLETYVEDGIISPRAETWAVSLYGGEK